MNFEDMSKEELIEYINSLNEEHSGKYGLVWDAEKVPEQVVVDCNKQIPVLKEIESKKINNGGEDNILIEGDNFHSLSVLNYTHRESIDVIYIDPPYNTGNKDFIYNDKFVDPEDGYRHSKWLNFMSKRLKLARNLLKDGGFILISIDDNEFAQLKLLCDKILGEHNFINIFIWQKNSSGKTEKEKFTVNTEYVLLYSKTSHYLLNEVYKPLADGTKAMYSKNDNDGRGNYRLYPLQKPGNPGPETTYDYVDNTGKVWKCPAKGWRIKQSKLKALENDGRLYLKGKSLSEKAYWNERASEGKRIDTLWNDLPENSSAKKELDSLLDVKNIFNNPKPTKLIKRCIQIAPKNSIVLDFFAGSGTTAQAVLELNKEDGGNRKFILCTNNENNICEDITYQRIKTVITGKRKDNSKYSDGLDGSLRYFKTDFVENNSTRDQIYFDLTEKCVPMLCVKESTFDLVEKTDSYIIYKDKSDVNYTCIYFDIYHKNYDNFLNKIKDIKNKKSLYIFSLDNRVEEYELDGIINYKVEAIPQKIYDLYRKLVKLSKEA